MSLKYHHIRILEDDYLILLKYKEPFESITQTFNKIINKFDRIPDKYIEIALR